MANGTYKEKTLVEVLKAHPEYFGTKVEDGELTVLVKFIDVDEGANMIYGFQHEVTEEIFRKVVETGTPDKHLHKVPVQKGYTYFAPVGTVHGIGKGIIVVEI